MGDDEKGSGTAGFGDTFAVFTVQCFQKGNATVYICQGNPFLTIIEKMNGKFENFGLNIGISNFCILGRKEAFTKRESAGCLRNC